MTQENTGNMPEKKFRAGAISATVWLNQGQNKKTGELTSYRSISLQRGYKDKNDQWQNTGSMRVNDLPRANLVLNQAYEYLVTKHDNIPVDTRVEAALNSAVIEEEPVM